MTIVDVKLTFFCRETMISISCWFNSSKWSMKYKFSSEKVPLIHVFVVDAAPCLFSHNFNLTTQLSSTCWREWFVLWYCLWLLSLWQKFLEMFSSVCLKYDKAKEKNWLLVLSRLRGAVTKSKNLLIQIERVRWYLWLANLSFGSICDFRVYLLVVSVTLEFIFC